jgi:hypothetical protein
MTLVVNLFGGPGTGKSTTAAGVFAQLKSEGIKTELVHEFAKDLTWENRQEALRYQPYIFGKQSYHVHRLLGKTDVIITDSPILLSSHIYNSDLLGPKDDALRQLGLATWDSWDTLSVFLERNAALHPFVQAGRNQDEAESTNLDRRIRAMLTDLSVIHYSVRVGSNSTPFVVELIHEELRRRVPS